MEGKPSNYFLDKYISADLSTLTVNNAGYRDNTIKWVNAFILNSAFRHNYQENQRLLIMNLLRRTESSFNQYNLGSSFLDEFLQSDRNSVSAYFNSVACFESSLSYLYQAFMFGRRLTGEAKIFISNDNSPLDRLNKLYNTSKHYDERIIKDPSKEVNTVPIWLTNEGIKSDEVYLFYNELHEMMNEMEFIANKLIK